ncbi:hypothetical protein O181_041965 [Austropuccinia psidii MF-1]|uniref:Uncharacterized protein n=1 Tax=Austropuccinia psidii MF-1 TaxID=1389203 RepID=A0A9Q3DJQ4_9BASI|nr:hypothetical protein [Austropuccinia psidii MF-1]
MDQVLQLHQLLKDLFEWSMENKRFNLASHWAELGESCQSICLKEIDLKDLMIMTKCSNPTRHFRLLEVRASRIRENQAIIQAIEEQLTQTGPTQIPSGSQVAGQISSPVASHHSDTNRSMAKSHHSLQSQEVSRRRQGYKGKNKTTFSQRKRESDPIIQKLLDLFAELEASHERLKKLTASMDRIAKNLQEGHAQLSKASEETKKRLNIVFEEQHHSRRDRDCLDQDINKFFSVHHNIKPQPHGDFMDNPYYQDNIKPDAMLARSPLQ